MEAIIGSQSVYEQNMSIFKLKESKISTSHLIVLDQAISLMWVAKLNEPPFSAPRGAIMGDAKNVEKKLVSFNSELLETSKKHIFKKSIFSWNFEKKILKSAAGCLK